MRKLATAAVAFSIAVFASYNLVPPGFYFAYAALCALLSLSALFLKGDTRTRVLLIFIAAAVGFSVSYVSNQYKTLPARELAGTEQSITATVTDYPEIHESYSTEAKIARTLRLCCTPMAMRLTGFCPVTLSKQTFDSSRQTSATARNFAVITRRMYILCAI